MPKEIHFGDWGQYVQSIPLTPPTTFDEAIKALTDWIEKNSGDDER